MADIIELSRIRGGCNRKLQSLLILWILTKETSLHQKAILTMALPQLSKRQNHSRHSVQAVVSQTFTLIDIQLGVRPKKISLDILTYPKIS